MFHFSEEREISEKILSKENFLISIYKRDIELRVFTRKWNIHFGKITQTIVIFKFIRGSVIIKIPKKNWEKFPYKVGGGVKKQQKFSISIWESLQGVPQNIGHFWFLNFSAS